MGGWNRSRYVTGHRDRSAAASRPPRPPPAYGDNDHPVPYWEREFIRHVGNITWERFCENKQYVGSFNIIDPWDDSGAFDNFQNTKARFWVHYHGQPSDIPLLDDPDLYINKVDHHCKVDPELIAELDSIGLPFESDNNSAPATGEASAGADNQCTQNGSGNWDIYIEKPAEVNKWDSEANLAPGAAWGGKANLTPDEAVWRGQGWGDALEKRSWHDWSKNHYTPNNWNSNFHVGSSNNRYHQQEDPSRMSSGRKRNGGSGGGGYPKQRNLDEGQHQQQRNGGWQPDDRGRSRQCITTGLHKIDGLDLVARSIAGALSCAVSVELLLVAKWCL